MKMDEFRKAIVKEKFECLHTMVESAEFYMSEILKRKEGECCTEALLPLTFNLGRMFGEIAEYDLPGWCVAYNTYNLYTEYKYRVMSKIRNFYYDEL